MSDREVALLLRVLNLTLKISNETVTDVFFNYFSHIKSFTLCYCKNGYEKEIETYVKKGDSYCVLANEENLEYAIEELKKLRKEAREVQYGA